MEDWMRRRIKIFETEKERNIVKLSGKAIQAIKKDLPYTSTILSNFMWIEVTLLTMIRQFEEWYEEK